MDNNDLITRLRSIESRSKGDLLEEAARAIEHLAKELEMCRAEREALYNLAKNYPREECGTT